MRLGLNETARATVAMTRSCNPARRVGGGRKNVSGRYPSRKMGTIIQFESHRVELPFIHELERDQEVLEYYDQPPPILLKYHQTKGRRVSVMHTPDYFVLRRDSAGWVECKTAQDLEILATKSPQRYLRVSDGSWHCPPGEMHASSLGLNYTVWSSAHVDWILQRNLQFLEDYMRFDSADITRFANPSLKAVIEAEPGIFLQQLLERTRGVVEPDEVYLLIASGQIYVDLSAGAIAEPDKVHIFANKETAIGYRLISDQLKPRGPTIEHANSQQSQVLEGRGEAFQLLAGASEQDLAIANQRFNVVKSYLADKTPSSVPARTVRLWVAQYRVARELYGNGYVGLLPKTQKRGNRTSRLPEEVRSLLTKSVENDYESLKQKTKTASWAALKRKCDEAGIATPSYVTFCTAVRARPAFEQKLKRQGHRAAYMHAPFYFELERKTPRHGDRPFEIGHIDHTQLDIEVVCSHTGRPLGRPWMTVLIDAFSRRCFALYLTFDAPSYRSCMMILRDCVRRFSRLPQIIVVDGGPESQSTYFETLLARYECTKKTRPAAKARFGSVCERLFGTTNTQFIHNLRGNTQITRNVRQVTKSNNPAGQAAWTLACLYDYLSCFLFEIYDSIEHPALGQAPRDAYSARLKDTGIRVNRQISYDQDYLMATLPTTQRGTAKVLPGRGIMINYIYYWSEAFRDPAIENHDVDVRYDPFDIGTTYAFVKKHWTECHSEHYVVLQGRSQREIMLASKELRRQHQLHPRERISLTARKLADFLESAEAEEGCLLQKLRDRESRSVRQLGPVLVPNGQCSEVTSQELQPVDITLPISALAYAEATEIYGEF